MKKIIATGMLAILAIACMQLCVTDTNEAVSDDIIREDVSKRLRNIVVITDQPITRSGSYGDSVRFQSTFESIALNEIVVIDGAWVEKQNQSTVYGDIKALVDRGNPILLAADSADAISTDRIGRSTGYSPSANVYGVILDPDTGTTYCYSASNGGVSDSFESAIRWVDNIDSKAVQTGANNPVPLPILCAVTESTGSFGTTTA